MKTLSVNTIEGAVTTSNQRPETNTPRNMQSNLDGITLSCPSDVTVTATDRFGKTYSINPLAGFAWGLTKLKLSPELLEFGRIQDKLVIPELGTKPYQFESVKTPLPDHYLTAHEYLQNCLDLLPSLPPVDCRAVHDLLNGIDAQKASKADILAIVEQAKSMLIIPARSIKDLTATQVQTYEAMVTKEQAIANAKMELDIYLDDIKVLSERKLSGFVKPVVIADTEQGKAFTKLLTESYGKFVFTGVIDGLATRTNATIELK